MLVEHRFRGCCDSCCFGFGLADFYTFVFEEGVGQFPAEVVKESIHVCLRFKVRGLDKLDRGDDPPGLDHRLVLVCLPFFSFPGKILLDLGQSFVFQAYSFGLGLADMRETILG